jgi:hypothetical protein
VGFKLTTSGVIGTDCIGSYKSNYHTIPYLDLTNDQECKSCPPGTYSLGDGDRFEEWNTIPDGFTSSAETFSRGYGLRDDQTTKDKVLPFITCEI